VIGLIYFSYICIVKDCTSKGDKIKGVIFKYLDNKNYVFKETAENYYFLNNENDIYCQSRLRKRDMVCVIEYKLIRQIERFFCIDYHIVENIIGEYIENTVNIKVSNIVSSVYANTILVETHNNVKVSNTKSLVNIETSFF